MNEHKLTKKVGLVFRDFKKAGVPIWWKKMHGGQFQTPGLPDFIVCVYGIFCVVELKNPESAKEPEADLTALQARELALIEGAGGRVLVAKDAETVRGWIGEIVGLFKTED